MSESLNMLIALSVGGSGVLLIAYLITCIYGDKMNAKWHYWNRKLSLFFFLIPLFLVSRLFHLYTNNSQLISIDRLFITHENAVWLSPTLVQTVCIIWVIGAAITGLRFFYSYQQFNKQLKLNIVLPQGKRIIQQHVYKHLEDMKLANKINISFCQVSVSPFLIGIFKPTIVLPMYDIPLDELDMIIKHELIHYKRNDLWIKKAMLLASIVHWYNPLIHVLRKDINKWCELSCDESVVLEMSHAERKNYGSTILNMIQRENQDLIPSLYGASFSSTGSTNMKNRLIKIVKVKKCGKPIVVLSFVVLLALGSVGIASAAFTHENRPIVAKEIEQTDHHLTTLDLSNISTAHETEGDVTIISVKRSDEAKFSKEDWEEILKQVENNEVIFEED